MKVIDLLNKIANGEEIPKEIEYSRKHYYLTNNHDIDEFGGAIGMFALNDEIEILDEGYIEDTPKEDKKIGKDNLELDTQIFKYNPTDLETLIIREMIKNRVKIEKIIDRLNGDSNE